VSFIFPFSASVLQAASFTLDKVILSIKKVTYKTYVGISFPLIAIFTFIIFLIFDPPLNISLFAGKFFWLILLSIILTIATNLIFYRALKSDLLSEIQTIELFREIPLIIFAALFFPSERNFLIIFLSLIATVSIIWSHWEKGHFRVAKKTLPYLLWTLVMAPFTGILAKTILELWNPISFQLVQNGVVGVLFALIFFKSIKSAPKKSLPFLILTNILTTIAWILYFFSYQISGIVYTVLIFSLQPVLVYFASLLFLKEKFHKKKFAAFIIIILAISLSQILG